MLKVADNGGWSTAPPRTPTEREFERWLTQDAGLTRSQARAVIRFGHKGLTMQDAAAGHPQDRLVAQIQDATRLLRLSCHPGISR